MGGHDIGVCADAAGPGRTGAVGPGGTVHYYGGGRTGGLTLCGQAVGYDYGTDYEEVFARAREAGTKVYRCPPCEERRASLP